MDGLHGHPLLEEAVLSGTWGTASNLGSSSVWLGEVQHRDTCERNLVRVVAHSNSRDSGDGLVHRDRLVRNIQRTRPMLFVTMT